MRLNLSSSISLASIAVTSSLFPGTAFALCPISLLPPVPGGSFIRTAAAMAKQVLEHKKEPRIELFFKTEHELRDRVRLLSGEGYSAFSLVNKNAGDEMLTWLDICFAEVPHARVCVHYSLRYNKGKGLDAKDATFQRFQAHLDTLETRGYGHRADVLLVSGSGPKTPLDSVHCLEMLAQERSGSKSKQGQRGTSLGVAFNPYYQDSAQCESERARLRRKLATRQVETVFLQFGSDLQLLTSSLEWLRGELEVQPVRIVGSLFLPNKQLIAQQRFRPWNGVFLSEDYLSGPERAEAINFVIKEPCLAQILFNPVLTYFPNFCRPFPVRFLISTLSLTWKS